MQEKSLLLVALILGFAIAVFARPISSSLGKNGYDYVSSTSPHSYSAKDYIQDGLIAMWDGIENAGWGVHDENANKIVNLLGNTSLNVILQKPSSASSFKWMENYLVCTNILGNEIGISTLPDIYTIHIVFYGNTTWRPVFSYRKDAAIGGNSRADIFISGNPDSSILVYPKYGLPIGSMPVNSLTSITIVNKTSFYLLDSQISSISLASDPFVHAQCMTVLGYTYNSRNGFNGKFGHLAIYSRALTTDEISHNYLVDKERFNLP